MSAARCFAAACAASVALPLAAAAQALPENVPEPVALAMMQLAQVMPEDFVMDLGSGDGRVVIVAARRFGARGLGVEPLVENVDRAREAARAAGIGDRAHFRQLDIFKADLSPASVVALHLNNETNLMLRPRLEALRPGTRIVSRDADMGEWVPDRKVRADSVEGSSQLLLWIVPARLDGDWCGVGKHRGTLLRFTQNFQKVHGTLSDKDDKRDVEGHVEGSIVRVPGGLTFTYDGGRLRATYAAGTFAPLKGAAFARRRGPACK